MCFHGNQHPSSIKHPFISLYSKYHPFMFICLLNMNSPVFPSLDDIYCITIDLENLFIRFIVWFLLPGKADGFSHSFLESDQPRFTPDDFCMVKSKKVGTSAQFLSDKDLQFANAMRRKFHLLIV